MGFDAEYSYVPKSVTTKAEFYDHVLSNLKALLGEDGEFQQNWVGRTSPNVAMQTQQDKQLLGRTERQAFIGCVGAVS